MSSLKKINDLDQSSEERKKFTPASYSTHSYDKSSTVQSGNQSNPPPTSTTFFIGGRCAMAVPYSFDEDENFLKNLLTSSSTSTRKLKPALVYIFNHENFDTGNEARSGTSQDVDALVKTFDQLKCEVQVIKDATVATIKSMVQILESKSFEERSALVIVILTHGGRNETLAARDSEYSLDDDVIFPLLRNQTLINKPKLVFVQACKGARGLGGFKPDTVQPHGSPAELLLCYSTYEGFVSYRDDVDGSLYIQTLCEALQKSGKTKDIMAIMTEVTGAVKANTQDRQIPSVTSTLTSKYTFGDYM